jgi:hypothetical protein
MEAIRSSETSDKTGTTRCYTPEEDILHSHRRENLKSYNNRIAAGNSVVTQPGTKRAVPLQWNT